MAELNFVFHNWYSAFNRPGYFNVSIWHARWHVAIIETDMETILFNEVIVSMSICKWRQYLMVWKSMIVDGISVKAVLNCSSKLIIQ